MSTLNKNLGKDAIDAQTEFKGKVVAYCEYLYGEKQYGLQRNALNKDSIPDIQWVSEDRIKFI